MHIKSLLRSCFLVLSEPLTRNARRRGAQREAAQREKEHLLQIGADAEQSLRDLPRDRQGDALKKLAERIYSSEVPLQFVLSKIFVAGVENLGRSDMAAALAATEYAKQYAAHDRTSLRIRASEQLGLYRMSFPDFMLDEIAQATPLYRAAASAERKLLVMAVQRSVGITGSTAPCPANG